MPRHLFSAPRHATEPEPVIRVEDHAHNVRLNADAVMREVEQQRHALLGRCLDYATDPEATHERRVLHEPRSDARYSLAIIEAYIQGNYVGVVFDSRLLATIEDDVMARFGERIIARMVGTDLVIDLPDRE